MMNMSYSGGVTYEFPVPVTALKYRDIAAPAMSLVKGVRQFEAGVEHEGDRQPAASMSAQELDDLLSRVRLEAAAETEQRMRAGYEAGLEKDAGKIRTAIELFGSEQKDYFARVESEVVQLALAISAKILHREAHVDPMLIAALVRVAVDKLHDGSRVSVRIPPKDAIRWRDYFSNPLNGSVVEIVEDANLGSHDCILETDLGSANFSIDAQLKEVEQGFFDLLAQRPGVK